MLFAVWWLPYSQAVRYLPGRKPLAGDPLQQKKQKKVEKQQVVWPRLKKGGRVPGTVPGRRVMEKTDRKIPS